MTDITARLALPLLESGQAQKEVTHNEALARLDLAVQASVLASGLSTPPVAPADGQAWIVGDSPTGAWTGQGRAVAGWTVGGWRFVAPFEGMAVWSVADALVLRFIAGAWVAGRVTATRLVVGGVPVVGPQQAPIAAPIGGATVDVEARTTISVILQTLRSHGLIAG
ncbi:DUF2793 domain-containing protein [Sphingomonas sp. CROZ-RG-20F-R02-07]|uniref:DUF2793 domain-containing protein n=1 Tax=Sphingomonas sp. CROZ-RG-20F-R02-07 TaxID=2914832 RepID=UPI001F57A341|nr:DUF2793 domain-containing protein [Sphingomonas sp. CROZ-RG-20F-R02-07]